MNSHTVPKKLLEQFAYREQRTQSLRLWRYQWNRPPRWDASPKSATVVEGHFADPRDALREEMLETRLNQGFENPVHEFIEQLGYRTFVFSMSHIRQLTSYVTLLFNRSKARHAATAKQMDVTVSALRDLVANEERLSEIAARWTLEAVTTGNNLHGESVEARHVKDAIEKMIEQELSSGQQQHNYSDTMERAMSLLDDAILSGKWGVVETDPADPFIIGDAPVVTWERRGDMPLILGQGFNKPDVEIILPVSPIACLHVLPRVQRTRPIQKPTAIEVNQSQAAFATDYCYGNVGSDEIDRAIQPHFGRAKIGVNAFSMLRGEFPEIMFDLFRKA